MSQPLIQRDTFVVMSYAKRSDLPEQFRRWQGVRYAERFVEYVLDRFTQPGDVVLDPFAGFGTSLIVAEEMGRIPFGIEFLEDRCDFIRTKLRTKEIVIQGDARELSSYDIPQVDLVLTGPPYGFSDTDVNPLSAYTSPGVYADYMADIRRVFAQVAAKLIPGGRTIIEAANIRDKRGRVTPLAWDIAREVSTVLTFDGEIVFGWEDGYA